MREFGLFLAYKGIDSAFAVSADIGVFLHALDTVQTAYAALDILSPALFHLIGPAWVGDMRTAQRDYILTPFGNLSLCLLWTADKIGSDNGYTDLFLDRLCHILSPAEFKTHRLQPVIEGVVCSRRNVYRVDAGFLEKHCHLYAFLESVTYFRLAYPVVTFVHG